jgi:flagellar hook-basal body complex protein FliE
MPNFDRGTSGLPKGFIDDYNKIVKKLSKGKGYLTLSKSDKKKVWATLGKIYNESVNESDLGYTYKKGKTVKVKHKKSGKELVIVDKPDVRKKYEKLGFFTESVNEGQTQSIDGKDLLDFLMKRFKMSKSKAIATMKKQKMDLSFLKKESVNEGAVSFWQDMFRPGPIPKKYITQLIKKKGELPSKSHIKKIYKDNGNPSSSELAKSWKQLTKEKYVRAASGMWRWNADFTGWESVTEGGMGILSTDQADVLQGIVMRNKSKNLKALLSIVMKNRMFKGVDKKELLGYIDGAKQFVKYMKSNPMESVNEASYSLKPEKRRKLKHGEVEVMKGRGSRQRWFYFMNGSDVRQLIKLGRNSAFPTGITNNNSKLKFDKNLHIKESVNEGFSSSIVKKAVDIAKKMSGDMTGAVKKIEKIKKGLSDDSKVKATLRTANESVNEAVEPAGNMAKIQKIVKNKQATKLGGVMIDMQSANLLMKVYDKVSDKDKEKMNTLNSKVLTRVIEKLWSRVNLRLPI